MSSHAPHRGAGAEYRAIWSDISNCVLSPAPPAVTAAANLAEGQQPFPGIQLHGATALPRSRGASASPTRMASPLVPPQPDHETASRWLWSAVEVLLRAYQ